MNALAETAPAFASAGNPWARMLTTLQRDGKSYALQWLDRVGALEVREDALVLAVPDRFFRDWLDDHYRQIGRAHV